MGNAGSRYQEELPRNRLVKRGPRTFLIRTGSSLLEAIDVIGGEKKIVRLIKRRTSVAPSSMYHGSKEYLCSYK